MAPGAMPSALSLEEAQDRLLALAAEQRTIEHLEVDEALGRYLASTLTARRTQPAADLSAMDGYAVRTHDLPGPWQVVGESACGHPFAGTLRAAQAVRIATGALVPDGASTVLVQEDCQRDGERLLLTGTPPHPPGRHIRPRGMDFAENAALLPPGTRIGPAQIALAISAGHGHLPVYHRPRVTIIDSGDELAPPGEPCPPHRIPASNGAMLATAISCLPCDTRRLGPVPDDLAALTAALDGAIDADVIVTSGGASVGDHDLIRPALEACGATLDFWRVAIKPGKPLLVATREIGARRQIIVGLPGNPVASMVTAYFFVLPLLRRLLGSTSCRPRAVPALLYGTLPSGGPRREFRRGLWNGAQVSDGELQDSGALASLARSNCLILREALVPAAADGERVLVYPLENGGIT